MNRLFPLALVIALPLAEAQASSYLGEASATLRITDISLASDSVLISLVSLGVDRFGEGFGDVAFTSGLARVIVNAADPTAAQIGDSLQIVSSASGAANTPSPSSLFPGSRAQSFAGGQAAITVTNNSSQDVVVGALFSYELSASATVANADLETAFSSASFGVSPPSFTERVSVRAPDPAASISGTRALSLPVAAGQSSRVEFSTRVDGGATASRGPAVIPEPASILVWLLIAGCVGGTAIWRGRPERRCGS